MDVTTTMPGVQIYTANYVGTNSEPVCILRPVYLYINTFIYKDIYIYINIEYNNRYFIKKLILKFIIYLY